MIKIENISKRYGQDILFEDVSALINTGERCAFVGRNGSGKTTLFRIIAGTEHCDEGCISVPKDYSFGVLEQHLDFSHNSIREEVISGLPEYHHGDEYRAEKVLSGLGFKEEEMYQHPNDFSGGYQLRVKLAKVLVSEPDCLLLDEPTNYLDLVAIKWLKRFLSNWPRELVIISHDLDFLNTVCNITIGIHRSQLHKISGTTSDYFEYLCQEEEIYEKTRSNIEKKKANLENFVNRFGAKASKASQAQSKRKAIERLPALKKLSQLYNLNFKFNHYPCSNRKFVEAQDVFFSYPNMKNMPPERYLIENFSTLIENGERVAIIGKNGRGKSTLLKLLAEEETPSKGSVNSADNLKIGYFGQMNIERLNLEHTIEEEISLANPSLAYGAIRKICGIMMFSGERPKKKISVLSGGERSRVLLGKILAQECNLLLLDEPTNHLDIESIEALVNAIEVFPGAVVIVSHSEVILESLPQRFIICHELEQKNFIGNYEELLEKWDWDDGDSKPKKKKNNKDSKVDNKPKNATQIKSLKGKIKKLEENIVKKESKLKELNDSLIPAYAKSDRSIIQELAPQTVKLQSEIETLFGKLEQCSNKLSEMD